MKPTSKYSLNSQRMLQFLWENPGSTSDEIRAHLNSFDKSSILALRLKQKSSWGGPPTYITVTIDEYTRYPNYYHKCKIIWKKMLSSSEIRTCRYAHLLSPYYSKTMAADRMGSVPHPHCERKTGNRRWFYRELDDSGRYRYYITLIGYVALHLDDM